MLTLAVKMCHQTSMNQVEVIKNMKLSIEKVKNFNKKLFFSDVYFPDNNNKQTLRTKKVVKINKKAWTLKKPKFI